MVKEKFEDAVFDKKFDGIIFCDSLHHVDSPILSITKALSLLTSNGKLFILEIAPKNVFLKVLLFDSRILCHYRKHTWTKKSFEKIIKSSGGKIEKTIMHNINAPLFIVTNKHD